MHILGNTVASQKEFDDHSKKVISTLAAIEEDLEKTQSLLSRTNERVQDENEKLKYEISQYRTLVASRYQAISPSEVNKVISGNEFIISRKYDGEFWYLSTNGKQSELLAPNGRVIRGKLPILELAENLPSGWLLAGELFVANPGKR
jgi:ATP-dependent DNA ligase